MVDDGDHLARYALEEVERIDLEREAQLQAIAEAEAVVAEWAGPPDQKAALAYYEALLDLIRGRVGNARGAQDVNRALHDVLAGIWFDVREGRLRAEFEVRVLPDDPTAPNGLAQVLSRDLAGSRMTLPETLPGNLVKAQLAFEAEYARAARAHPHLSEAELARAAWTAVDRQTGGLTLVYVQPVSSQICLYE